MKDLFPAAFNLADAGGGGGAAAVVAPTVAPAAKTADTSAQALPVAKAADPPEQGLSALQASVGKDGAQPPPWAKGVPQHLIGETPEQTVERLNAAYGGARAEMAKRGEVPKAAADYKFELAPDVAKVFGDPTKDRGTEIFRTLVHKHGLTQQQAAGIYAEYHQEMIAAGVVTPFDLDAETKKLLGTQAAGLNPAQIRSKAGEVHSEAVRWIEGLEGTNRISRDLGNLARSIIEQADGIHLFKALRDMAGEGGVKTGGDAGGAMTRSDVDGRINDPRNDPRHPGYTPEFADETMRISQAFFGKQSAPR